MKILAISLLRLGDILLHREVVRGLQAQYPNAEIHFLINQQFEAVREIISEVQSWKLMPRIQIQDILVKKNQSSAEAYRLMEDVVADLNQEKYDLVLNFTHNFLSVRLMDLIQAKEKRGSAFENGKKNVDRNRWATYLNDSFSVEKGSRFHYVEVLARSLDIQLVSPSKFENRDSKTIYFQLLTSDEKKNWGLPRFHLLIQNLKALMPDYQFLGLCSPSEREQVLQVFQAAEIISPTLREAAQLLSQARLLVTGDTSLQHMAADVRCEVVSLFLGSADSLKTSAWQKGSWILTSKAACSPCRHSEPCGQSSHLCGESIAVSTVTELIQSLLTRQPILAFQSTTMNLSQSRFHQGHFETVSLQGEVQLERAVWACYLENEMNSSIPSYATVARENVQCSGAELWALEMQQIKMEQLVDSIKAAVHQISRSILVSQKPGDHQRLKDLIAQFDSQFTGQKDFVQQFHWAVVLKNEFEILKGYRKAILELSDLVEIRGKILKEARGLHVNEPRTFEEHPSQT